VLPGLRRLTHSLAPASGLHGLRVVRLVGLLRLRLGIHDERVLRVVSLVHVASLVRAIHGLASQATVMLLLLHAATDVLLLTSRSAHNSLRITLCARIAVRHGALLVGLGQALSATSARILFKGERGALGTKDRRKHNCQLHCRHDRNG